MMRLLAGHDQAQLSVWPIPVGSLLSRRAIRLPAGDQHPAYSQHPQMVDPPSRSSPKPATCSPALRRARVASFGPTRSARARPLYSLASSSVVGCRGLEYGHPRLTIGAGKVPASFSYSARLRVCSDAMISMSLLPSPGGLAAFQCHCSQRPEFTSAPSSSAKQVVGSRMASVWIEAGSTSLYSPTLRQNSDVSVMSGSMTTRNLSLEKASVSLDL